MSATLSKQTVDLWVMSIVFSRSLNITNQMNPSEETKNTPSPATKVRDVRKYTFCTSSNQLTAFNCGHTVKLTAIGCFSLLSDRLMRSLVAVQEVQVWMVTRMVPHQLFHNFHEWVTVYNIFGVHWFCLTVCFSYGAQMVIGIRPGWCTNCCLWYVQVSLTLEEKQRLAKEQEQAAKLRSQQPLAPQSVKSATTTPQVTYTLKRVTM